MAPAFGKPPKKPSTRLFGHVAKRQMLSKEQRAEKHAAWQKTWRVPAGSKPLKKDKSKVVPRAAKVPLAPRELTQRQKEILRVEAMRNEEEVLRAEFVAKREARQAAHAATNQAYREKCARERADEERKEADIGGVKKPDYAKGEALWEKCCKEKAEREKCAAERDVKAANAERNAIYDLAGDDEPVPKTKAPTTKAPKAEPKTGPKSKAPKAEPKTGPKSKAPYTGPFSDAPYTRPELGERSPSGSPPPFEGYTSLSPSVPLPHTPGGSS
jgi:hypothetical protein